MITLIPSSAVACFAVVSWCYSERDVHTELQAREHAVIEAPPDVEDLSALRGLGFIQC